MRKIIALLFCVLIACQLSAQSLQSAGQKPLSAEQINALFTRQMTKHNTPGVSFALINEGKLAYANSYGSKRADRFEAITSTTVFETASISKPVFAWYTMTLVEAGLLDLDKTLSAYFNWPDIAHLPDAKNITARMVLSHKTGLPNWRFFNEDGKLTLAFDPGSEFSYSGEGYEYLAATIAHLLNLNYEELDQHVIAHLAAPLGMKNSGFQLTPTLRALKAHAHEEGKVNEDLSIGFANYFGAAYSFHSNAMQFAPFMLALIHKHGLSKKTYDVMLTPHSRLPDDDSLRTDFNFEYFGLGLLIGTTPYGTKFAHGGMNPGFQGYFMVIPEQKFGYVYFGNSDTAIGMLSAVENCLLNAKCVND